jgi:hypothetical protein
MKRTISPYFAALLPIVALLAGLLRWLLQGSGNLYTDADRRFYVPDPDLGWRVIENGPPWLGLELLGIIAGVAVGLIAAAWLLRRLEKRRGAPIGWARIGLWIAAALPLAVPVWAFAGGFGPDGAREQLPAGIAQAPTSGIEGSLPGLPAGTYRVQQHSGTSITARISAGGEAFESRFADGIEGSWRGDPGDLKQPMAGEISAATEKVDTGIALRNKHAREEYLKAGEHPRIGFGLTRLVAASPIADGGIAFRGEGVVSLMGREHPVAVTGTLRAPDAAGKQRLGVAAGAAVLVATAAFELKLRETALAADASDFDGDLIPISASLVLVREAAEAAK